MNSVPRMLCREPCFKRRAVPNSIDRNNSTVVRQWRDVSNHLVQQLEFSSTRQLASHADVIRRSSRNHSSPTNVCFNYKPPPFAFVLRLPFTSIHLFSSLINGNFCKKRSCHPPGKFCENISERNYSVSIHASLKIHNIPCSHCMNNGTPSEKDCWKRTNMFPLWMHTD